MPTGPPHLCDASGDEVGGRGRRTEVEPAQRLRGVRVEHGTGCSLADDVGDGRQRLDRAGLVVDEHHRHERDVLVEGARQRVEVDDAPPVDGHDATSGRRHRMEDGVVLDRAAHDRAAVRAEHAADGEVVGLGAAAREHDLAGLTADDCGELLTRAVERRSRADGPARGRPTGCRRRRARTGTIAASASGRSGVVAAWSR